MHYSFFFSISPTPQLYIQVVAKEFLQISKGGGDNICKNNFQTENHNLNYVFNHKYTVFDSYTKEEFPLQL